LSTFASRRSPLITYMRSSWRAGKLTMCPTESRTSPSANWAANTIRSVPGGLTSLPALTGSPANRSCRRSTSSSPAAPLCGWSYFDDCPRPSRLRHRHQVIGLPPHRVLIKRIRRESRLEGRKNSPQCLRPRQSFTIAGTVCRTSRLRMDYPTDPRDVMPSTTLSRTRRYESTT